MDRLLTAAEAVLVTASPATRLESSVRARINAGLDQAGCDGNRSFQSIGQGLAAIGHVLGRHGVEWDETLNAHMFKGDTGNVLLHIAMSNEADAFSPTQISNSVVRMGWYKHQSGNYEITAYVS